MRDHESRPGAIVNKKDVRSGAGMFGYSHLYGGYAGGQAEFVRVPKANVGPLVIPEGLSDEQVLFLSDILPTGYQAAFNAEGAQGSTVAIFGAGPVGLMAAACAKLLGAERFEAKGSLVETTLTDLKMEGSSGKALRLAIASTRRGGVVSVPGVYAG